MSVKMADLQCSKSFHECCKEAEVPATRRQWKKWQKKMGKAYSLFKSKGNL